MISSNKILISLGSNKDREQNMDEAVKKLYHLFDYICFSEGYYTQPVPENQQEDSYLNRVAVAFTDKEPEEIIAMFKQIEEELGRTPEDKKTKSIPIDIDLLKWNEKVLKEEDMQQPYVIQGFELLPIP